MDLLFFCLFSRLIPLSTLSKREEKQEKEDKKTYLFFPEFDQFVASISEGVGVAANIDFYKKCE
jgi:hypothetical protein